MGSLIITPSGHSDYVYGLSYEILFTSEYCRSMCWNVVSHFMKRSVGGGLYVLISCMMLQQVAISSKIRENLKALDKERNEGNKLLYSMLPETIAVRLKQGENPINTCQVGHFLTFTITYV